MGSGVLEPGRADGTSTDDDVWMASRDAATVAWVRRTETGCWGLAWARSLPWYVVRRRVGSWAVWLAWRKALSRFVRRRGGVLLGTAAILGLFFLFLLLLPLTSSCWARACRSKKL